MTIICTTDALAGWTVEVDRETDAWYEEDLSVYGHPAICIYPKPAWTRVTYLVLPDEPKGAWL